MTTAIKVHVNGQYRATVKQDGREPVVVEGNYNGGSGEKVFWLSHPANCKFEITEAWVDPNDTRPALADELKNKDIGWAVNNMRYGKKVRRANWNGKGMWVAMQFVDSGSKMTSPYVYISTADNKMVPWLCSQTDLIASDWEIADEGLT